MKKINIRILLFFIFIIQLSSTITIAQNHQDKNIVIWSATKKLTIDDFGIKKQLIENLSSFAQFSINHQVGGFSFLQKNFNNKVQNCIIRSASWIDINSDTQMALQYQQTVFDIAEIYTRLFRKTLKENKKKSLSGLKYVEEINQKIMTEFTERRLEYDENTQQGKISDKQKEWELQIQKELDELKEFAYDYK